MKILPVQISPNPAEHPCSPLSFQKFSQHPKSKAKPASAFAARLHSSTSHQIQTRDFRLLRVFCTKSGSLQHCLGQRTFLLLLFRWPSARRILVWLERRVFELFDMQELRCKGRKEVLLGMFFGEQGGEISSRRCLPKMRISGLFDWYFF